MLTKRTCFIVGAGASAPYGFSTGKDLVREVLNNLKDHRNINSNREFLEGQCGLSQQDLDRFLFDLLRSSSNSVDAFLEHRPDLLDVGKAAIAHNLIRKEVEANLFTLDDASWLRYLFNRMTCPFDQFGDNPVSFVTFNYDRNIEHFLHTALCTRYRKDPDVCAKVMARIPIVHLHGSLGSLPWQDPNGRAYDSAVTAQALSTAVTGIKIIHEDLTGDRDADFQKAKRLIAEAEQIFFLGFGFDATNTNRLGLKKFSQPNQRILGTALGFFNSELMTIRTRLDERVDLRSNLDCIGLMREYVDW
jgi:hypothetical protein